MPTDIFSSAELELIRSLHTREDYPPEALTSLHELFISCIGNMAVNKAVDALRFEKNEEEIPSESLRFIRNLSYRTRHIDRIAPRLNDIFKSFTALKTGDLEEKISLEDYGILYDLSILYKDMEVFYEQGLMESPELDDLFEHAQKASEMNSVFFSVRSRKNPAKPHRALLAL